MSEIIISAQNIIEYMRLKKEGYRTAWCGEGKICLVKKEPKEIVRSFLSREIAKKFRGE